MAVATSVLAGFGMFVSRKPSIAEKGKRIGKIYLKSPTHENGSATRATKSADIGMKTPNASGKENFHLFLKARKIPKAARTTSARSNTFKANATAVF